MKIYRVTLETHDPIKRHTKYVAADNISDAWDEARNRGAEYNKNVRRNPCVVHSVAFIGENQAWI